MSIPARISIVTLGVADLERCTAFYQALGWKRSSASGDGVSFFLTNGAVLALFPYPELAADAHLEPNERPGFSGVSLAINVASTHEVDAILAEAETAGARILKPAEHVFWGGYSGYFADPDGNAWEVAHNPFFPLDEQGAVHLPE